MFIIDIAMDETQVSGWTCFSTWNRIYINILVLLVSSLYNLVNVDGRGLLPLALPLLFVLLGHRLGSFATLGSSLAWSLGWHSMSLIDATRARRCNLQGVSFNWSLPKSSKCQSVSKFWHLELFDVIYYVIWYLELFGRNQLKKTPCISKLLV